MSSAIGTATDYANLLDLLDTFLTSQGMALAPSYVGTGNGPISGVIGGSASVAEVITITFTDATHFAVVGAVTGAIGTGVVGTPFVSTHINFTITAGGTAFIATDAFTVSMTPPWTSKRRTAGTEMIWESAGERRSRCDPRRREDFLQCRRRLLQLEARRVHRVRFPARLRTSTGIRRRRRPAVPIARAQPLELLDPLLVCWERPARDRRREGEHRLRCMLPGFRVVVRESRRVPLSPDRRRVDGLGRRRAWSRRFSLEMVVRRTRAPMLSDGARRAE